MQKRKWIKAGLLAVAAVAVVILLVLLWPYLRNFDADTILRFTPQNPVLAALVLIGLYCSKNVLMVLPVVAFYIAAGMMFPLPWAIAVSYIGLVCEFSIGYFVGKKVGTDRVNTWLEKHPKAEKFMAMVRRNENTACFFCRIVPLPVPLDVMSMVFGATGISYAKFIVFSLLGISAPMIPFIMAGEAVDKPLSPEFLVPFGVSLLITGGAFVIYTVVEKRRKQADK